MPCPLSSSGLAHLYVSCKGGDGEIGGHSFSFADGGVQGKDQNTNAGSINPHLCQNRKGGPATYQGYWASPAYWNDGMNNNWIFYSATDSQGGDPPFPIDGYELTPSGTAGSYNPVPRTPNASTVSSNGSAIGFCQYSPTPSVSSSGTSASSGIVWAIEQPNSDNPLKNDCAGTNSPHAVLHAFCATAAGGRCTTALTELYNSTQNVTKTLISKDVTFSTPTIFNGRVYMGTRTEVGMAQAEVDVFGLCSSNGPSGCLQ